MTETNNNSTKQNIKVETEVSKKKKLVVNWPKGKFSIADLEKSHPTAVPITLRFRVKKGLENGTIRQSGKIEGEIGRPTLLFETVR
tara:strand:+ start:32403 stop:32660 length:258 start_codon:yes stop_codon:yes gene_type:complete